MTDRLTDASTQLLTGWLPPSAGQHDLRELYLEHLKQHSAGWSRNTTGAHLTASSLICAVDARQVLLTLHRRIGRWLQTGGHIESDDRDLAAAALREATEESGLTDLELDPDPLLLSRHEVPCGPHRPTFHLDVQFLVRAPGAQTPHCSAESDQVAWFGADALPEVDESVRELVAAASGRLRWS